ncbi:MAG: N-6 DNA methylase, partial [Ignavibacteria bacterium]|nr:N-6 DNA methylase [Ignavibacteria bacterium]
ATDEKFYSKIKPNAKNYFDILLDVKAAYNLFDKLDIGFNGSLFACSENEKEFVTSKHLDLIKKCFISGLDGLTQESLFADWRIFNFKIIPIELLSEIYENFLTKIEKSKSGTYYTPPSLVELILNEKLPVNKETNFNIKVLDPACGSGIFLVESFKRLVKRYENKHRVSLSDYDILKDILLNHIFGVEIDTKSIKVAAFSLYLALLENLDPITLWQNIKLPYLINDTNDDSIKEQGKNLFRRDTIDNSNLFGELEFDLVVGNPPFGDKNLPQSIIDYCEENKFAKEKVLPFIHKATLFAPRGSIALIFNTKILTNTNQLYQNFRQWLFNGCTVEKIYNFSILRKVPKDFGGQLFGSAVGPISILFFKRGSPKLSDERIVYYAPKSYIKTNMLEGIVIDASDVKYLPRTEYSKPDTKIWKILMWGGIQDFNIINKINSKFVSLETFIKNNNWKNARGLHNPDEEQIAKKQTFFPKKKIFKTRQIDRYYSTKDNLENPTQDYRLIDQDVFKAPFIMIKEGQKEKEYCATFVDYDAYFHHAVYGIKGKDVKALKLIVAVINSKFAKYFLSLTSSSWGIERERILFNEMMLIPPLIEKIKPALANKIVLLIDEIISIKKDSFFKYNNILEKEKEIDEIIFNKILGLSDKEIIVVKDTLEYSLDLFENKEKSFALTPITTTECYAEMLCNELNEFLGSQPLKANPTVYKLDKYTPLALVKISFEKRRKKTKYSKENISDELKKLEKFIYKKNGENIYFKKKVNYYEGNNIFIIRSNQQRFWSRTMAIEDSLALLLEISNSNDR